MNETRYQELTLGEIAEWLLALRNRGATRESIIYALNRVYWDEPDPATERVRLTKLLAPWLTP